MRVRPQRRLDRGRAGADQADDQAVERDADDDDERQRQPDRFPQQRAQLRREHLGERFDGVVEHGGKLNHCFPDAVQRETVHR